MPVPGHENISREITKNKTQSLTGVSKVRHSRVGRFYSKVNLDSLTDCGPFNSFNCRQFSKTDSKGKTLLTGSTELKPDSKTCIAISTQVGSCGGAV